MEWKEGATLCAEGKLTIPQALQLAIGHHRAGRLAPARALYHRILEARPEHADANHLLGVLAFESGDIEAALRLIRRALQQDATLVAAHYNLAKVLHRAGQVDEAVDHYEMAIELRPDHADALRDAASALFALQRTEQAMEYCHQALAIDSGCAATYHVLGNAQARLGQLEAAANSYQRALAIEPRYPEVCSNLAAVLTRLGRAATAVAWCERALAVRPDYASAHNNLGVALKELGRFAAAVASFRRALRLEPEDAEGWVNLGNALREWGRADEGIACYRRALALDADDLTARHQLGVSLREVGQREEAVACFRRVLEREPADERFGVRLELANLGVEAIPARTPVAYLKRFYAAKAGSWLQQPPPRYGGHNMMVEAIAQRFAPTPTRRVLDAGCGAGGLGPFLRGYASRLDGVDLSAEMLHGAVARGVYDHLQEVDLLDYLAPKTQAYDVVVAAAVFIHFATLGPPFAAVHRALRPAGCFVFSLFAGGLEDVTVNAFKMYVHSASYVLRTAEQTGFRVLERRDGVHEYHGQQPVPGSVFVLQRRGD